MEQQRGNFPAIIPQDDRRFFELSRNLERQLVYKTLAGAN
jgi:hypothetical protein